MTDVNRMRISDADRSEVIDILQRATVEGRLDLDELEDRVSSALAARTWSDVDPLLDDLPAMPEPEPDEDEDYDEEPRGSSAVVNVGSLATLAAGGVALTSAFATPWGALFGVVSAVLGGVLLLIPQGLSRWARGAVLLGMILGLLPTVWFVLLLIALGH
jgi:hypothetical protein